MEQTSSAFTLRHATHRLRRSLWVVASAAILGAVLGLAVATANPTNKATTLLSVRTSAVVATTTATESAAIALVSPAVITKAAQELGVDAGTLGSQLSAVVQSGTTLIDLTAVNADADAAVRNVTKVAEVAIQDYVDRSAAVASDVQAAGEEQLTSGTLSDETAERARSESIGSTVGTAQGESVTGAVTISIVSPALSAYAGGVSKPVGIILGAAAGVLLATLLVLSSSWRRRRKVRSAADLEDVPEIRAVIAGGDVAGLTGTVLSSDTRNVIVAGGGQAPRRATALALSRGLRENGYRVASVAVLGDDLADQPLTMGDEGAWTVGTSQSTSVLARAARSSLSSALDSDFVILELRDLDLAAMFLTGQRDYLAVLLSEPGERFEQVLNRVGPVRASAPILVMVDAAGARS